jgi:hypothetical protein
MSTVPIKDADDATRKIDVITRTSGPDTIETQAVAVVDPVTGTPLDFATQTTLAALLVAANAIKTAAEALNTKTTAVNTGAIAGTVALDSGTLAALETTTVGGTVAVSNMVAQGLTDAQLRASAIPISLATAPTTPVTGPLTDAQLRAAPVPISSAASYAEDTQHASGDIGNLMLAIRSDSDAPTAADGDYTILKMDEEGRLKVSSKPASFPDTTGNITANAQTVFANVDRASNVTISMVATSLVGHNATFEYSNNSTTGADGTWYGVQVARSNANTAETATGVLTSTPAYGWEVSVNAYKWIRVRATAHTSGTAAYTIKQGTYATEPVPIIQVTGTQPVSGTVTATVTAGTINPVVPANPYFVNSLATTNGALILTGTSNVSSFYATNEGATAAYVKLYNKATAPTVGTDVPEMIIPIPAAASGVPGVANPNIGFHGFRFALGLGIAITGAAVHTDTTAVAAGQVKVKLSRTV